MIEKTKCILVVDDDAAICRLVADVFETSEFHVLEARDGVEALKRIDSSCAAIDVLLVDVVMPRLNGAELARVTLSSHPTIKIIFMSGYPDEVLDRYGIPSSRLRYLRKPFTLRELEQAVRDELKK
jgi:DNA-binding response OmpR family regulator